MSAPSDSADPVGRMPAEVAVQDRFGRRWHLVGAGLSNVWRFGDLELPAASGRLLLRGPNGTGKTTALEALAPYLLDLDGRRLSAGKARTTSLSSLMREGSAGKRRSGYAWLTLAGPSDGVWSFGVRIQYSEGASPPVKVLPFAVPGRPFHELSLYGAARAALTTEQFTEAVVACKGQVFETEEDYVSHVAARLFGRPDRHDVATLAGRLRQVRNPTLLGDVSPQAAADALKESLPGVAEDVIGATAEALAESDATREAFTRDKKAAELLIRFGEDWCAHATEVVAKAHAAAAAAAKDARGQHAKVKAHNAEHLAAVLASDTARQGAESLDAQLAALRSEIEVLEKRDEYRAAGQLGDLRQRASAQSVAADKAAQTMQAVAGEVATQADGIRSQLEHLRDDLEEQVKKVRSEDQSIEAATPLLRWTSSPRPPLRAGGVVADPGIELVVHGDPEHLRLAAAGWVNVAKQHAERADAAALALKDHEAVEQLQREAEKKAQSAREAGVVAERDAVEASRALQGANELAGALLDAVAVWTQSHHHPAEDAPPPSGGLMVSSRSSAPWGLADVEELAAGEPGQVLAGVDAWAVDVLAWAEGMAGDLRSRARQARVEAAACRAEAGGFRREAGDLRNGRLLPLPRPEWAAASDDSVALGAALEWHKDFHDPTERALLEGAMAAAGLLGASVGAGGAGTCFWWVEPKGPVLPQNLSQMLVVDPAHPMAAAVAEVLLRVGVAQEIHDGAQGPEPGLRIGRDGTFCAGVLSGRVPGASDPALLAPASHVGARQRLEAALARAEFLLDLAEQLDVKVAEHEALAAQLDREAEAASALGRSFPAREVLRRAESRRAEVARNALRSQDVAAAAFAEAELLLRDLRSELAEWSMRTGRRGLPADPLQLQQICTRDTGAARALRQAAESVAGKLASRLHQILAGTSAAHVVNKLARAEADAQQLFAAAADTKTEVRVLEETAGVAIKEVVQRHSEAKRRHAALQVEGGPVHEQRREAEKALAGAKVRLEGAEQRLQEELQPAAARLLRALTSLLEVPAVAPAVLGDLPVSNERLLDQLAERLAGRRTLTIKTVLERADALRATLAGVWSIDPGENHQELLTFVLTHRDVSYTPVAAAEEADKLRVRAEHALAASEERALREFVIGRLPNAIGEAWTQLQDWVHDVNRKMRSAAASSGVGVQVRIPLRDDLAPAERSVHELSCKVSGADRTEPQQRQLRDSLQALLGAATGETMLERVASAVDIRDWVEVHYEVTRPDGNKQRWNSKTGLSGGERRLVVLAPMLAAIAANYDRWEPKSFRLLTLDEVPAEVDERGREGLARYIAALDLDLICTSYLWDGCPGAWDGVDAQDLEAGSDGTVVAFPMLVRGPTPIPEVLFSPRADSRVRPE